MGLWGGVKPNIKPQKKGKKKPGATSFFHAQSSRSKPLVMMEGKYLHGGRRTVASPLAARVYTAKSSQLAKKPAQQIAGEKSGERHLRAAV